MGLTRFSLIIGRLVNLLAGFTEKLVDEISWFFGISDRLCDKSCTSIWFWGDL